MSPGQAALKSVPFVKANGCGNDFLIVEEQYAPPDNTSFTHRICDRHSGVGADGVEWISVKAGQSDSHIAARLVNADGSEAEISGNGTRCVAAYYVAQYGGEAVKVSTGAGVKTCTLIQHRANQFEFEMNMGRPVFGGEKLLHFVSGPSVGFQVSMGNPHFVDWVKDFVFDWQSRGAEVQRQAAFPNGVNVEFVRVVDEHQIEVRFFERGVGETKSSGTGSCAAVVAAIVANKAFSPVTVASEGGRQNVCWAGRDQDLFLTGPAQLVCRGEFFI